MKPIKRLIVIISMFSIVLFLYSWKESARLTSNFKKSISKNEYSVLAVLWQQHAAEKRALQYQAYNIARYQIKEKIKAASKKKKLAVITDIDETVLDNSPFNGKLIVEDEDYTFGRWKEWSDLAQADTIPGALGFFKYVVSFGVEVFYVTNRKFPEQQATLKNLKRFGFPFADVDHLYTRGDTVKIPGDKSGNKKTRRNAITKEYEVLMLLGDNLDDFSELFYGQSSEERNFIADSLREKFGSRFIVLPNTMYGTWETKGIYDGEYGLTDKQKYKMRLEKVISY